MAELERPALADVVLTHGLGEYSGRYEHVAATLAGAGLRLWAYDLRGHGRSEGPRGDALNYGLLVEDLAQVVARVRRESEALFVMGHSLGGQITLSYLLQRGGEGLRGAVITSPGYNSPLRLHAGRWRWRRPRCLFSGVLSADAERCDPALPGY